MDSIFTPDSPITYNGKDYKLFLIEKRDRNFTFYGRASDGTAIKVTDSLIEIISINEIEPLF